MFKNLMRLNAWILMVSAPVLLVTLVTHFKWSESLQRQNFMTNLVTVSQMEKELECLTRNIYYEAAHEPVPGKLAVAQVTMNRVANKEFPNDVCSVVHQRTVFDKRVVCQFSWLCDGTVKRHGPVNQVLWNESRAAAKKVLFEGWRLPTLENALYYHADYVNPRWRKDVVLKIGRHIFYQDRDV
jgi:spore germination cell wall hydrolase CwlJ-like protein